MVLNPCTYCETLPQYDNVVIGVASTMSLLNFVFYVFQSSELRTIMSKEPTISPIPAICITLPPNVHPYNIMRESQCAAPQLHNTHSQFAHTSAATLHPT